MKPVTSAVWIAAVWAASVQTPGVRRLRRPVSSTLQTEGVEEVAEVTPPPLVETDGLKLSPTRPEVGRLEMVGIGTGSADAGCDCSTRSEAGKIKPLSARAPRERQCLLM